MAQVSTIAPRIAALLAVILYCPAAAGEVRFVQGASETTVTGVLKPWTQSDACSCCVCWETALATILAYWDDHSYQGNGPWEHLLYGSDGFDAALFRQVTEDLYTASGVGCDEGSSWSAFFIKGSDTKAAKAVTNDSIGYSFLYDEDVLVWFDTDIKDEIDADRPVYYGYYPEGDAGHAVVVVGYDDADETLFLYKNWAPVVTLKGFDEATYAQTLNITPGGRTTPPSSWSCTSAQWEGHDGCHCDCGAYDPDCDDDSQPIINCAPSQQCDLQGQCTGQTCEDECIGGTTRCISDSAFQSCGDHDADGCTEWGVPNDCYEGMLCSGTECVEVSETCQPRCELGTQRCFNNGWVERCIAAGDGCGRWETPTACPSGQSCFAGECRVELCDNGLDDDGDRMIDCADIDCARACATDEGCSFAKGVPSLSSGILLVIFFVAWRFRSALRSLPNRS